MVKAEATSGVVIRRDVWVPMRDGTRLAADVFLPVDGPSPALLLRSPYGKAVAGNKVHTDPYWYARHGFAVVVQDVRGRFGSEGDFYPYRNEAQDGYDTVEWVAIQEWSNGAVGMYGHSYPGAIQFLAASMRPPHLRALAPALTGSSFYEGWTYLHGALSLNIILGWVNHLGQFAALRAGDLETAREFAANAARPLELYGRLPLRQVFSEAAARYIPYWEEWLDHPTLDDYWTQWSFATANPAPPSLHIGGWYDVFVGGTVESFVRASKAGPAHQMLVIGPWFHQPLSQRVGLVDFGPEGGSVIDDLQTRFFSRWLRGERNGVEEEPAVRLFVMGYNRWQSWRSWPPPAAEMVLHLSSDGRASTSSEAGRLTRSPAASDAIPDAYRSDPSLPVMVKGGRGCCVPEVDPMGVADQRSVESRNDVLVYTSDVLTEDRVVVGTPSAVLFVATDGPTTDVMVRLVDVHPDGTALNVSDGNLRLPLDSGQHDAVRLARIDLSPTGIAFKAGHRIRLDIMSTFFPFLDRSPNSDVDPSRATAVDLRVATNIVFHDPRYPSRLELPVVKA